MKHLKSYLLYEAVQDLSPDQIEWLNKCVKGGWKLNPRTGLVDVVGDFDCSNQGISNFKGVRFGVVEYCFYCDYNRLTTLEGAPHEVRKHFYCSDNLLTSLEGAPRKVGGGFACSYNQLTTLEGAPHEVEGYFSCHRNQLTTLEGAPREVGEDFSCEYNLLTSLVGAPQKVGWGFYCPHNHLTSLEGAPQKPGRRFSFEDNPVSEKTFDSILELMKGGNSYLQVVEKIWNEIPIEDQALMYNEQFKWVGAEEAKKLKALARYSRIKNML